MDKNKVKLALHSMNDDIGIIVNKFLEADKFNFLDLCYWYDPSISWWTNKKYANVILRTFKEEKCCIGISAANGTMYKKTETFVDLLNEMLRIEYLLKGT